jgi:hypothetical protein
MQDLPVGAAPFGKGSGVRRKPPDKIIESLSRLIPADAAVFLVDFWRLPELGYRGLSSWVKGPGNESFNGPDDQAGACIHQPVVQQACRLLFTDNQFFMQENPSFVNLFIKQKSGNPGLFFTVDQSPLYRGRSTVLGQKGSMQVEGAQRWFGPHLMR